MPTRVVIPTLEVDAPVVPIKAAGRALVPPGDPQQLGWWADGARPGAARGSALVTGHTVHTGGGALDHLDQLSRGDLVLVRTSRGWIEYVVRGVEIFSKGITAQRAQQLFSQTSRGRLVLTTCTDWDGVRYLSNTVVTATPASR
ncbi:LPXTG-site transpeptidase (sortase) family protein [Marmoricola sp. OAE513]|uniref:class F sortase n=1 Tax=Marmoricola sp. OAE513 TaxID=2817894 RepID=UPI001AE859D1